MIRNDMSLETFLLSDNTEYAFAAKSDAELKKANFLFGIMGKAWLVNMGLTITPLAIKWGIPFTKTLIRQTIFINIACNLSVDMHRFFLFPFGFSWLFAPFFSVFFGRML